MDSPSISATSLLTQMLRAAATARAMLFAVSVWPAQHMHSTAETEISRRSSTAAVAEMPPFDPLYSAESTITYCTSQ